MRLFLILLAAAAVALAGVGCGGDDETSTGDRAEATGTTDSSTSTETTTDTTTPKAEGRTSTATTPKSDPARTSTTPPSATVTTPGPGPAPTSGTPAEKAAVKTAVVTFYRALSSGKGAQACALMSTPIRKQFTREIAKLQKNPGGTCAELATKVATIYPAKLRKSLVSLKVTRVDVEGNKATAFYKVPGIPASNLPVIREGGDWKVGAPVSAPSSP
jgi:hypothetical protein